MMDRTYRVLASAIGLVLTFALAANVQAAPRISANLLNESAAPGEGVTVEIVVSNDGVGTETDLAVEMTYPSGLASLSEGFITGPFDAATSCAAAGFPASCEATELLVWNIGSLGAGESVRFSLSPLVSGSALDGDAIVMNFDLEQSSSSVATASRTLTVDDSIALSLAIDENADPVVSGDTVVYTLRYGNVSGTSVAGVGLTLSLPGELSFVSATGGGSFSGGDVTWSLGTLATGQTGEQTVVATASGSNGALIFTEGTIDGTQSAVATERVASATSVLAASPPVEVALIIGPNSTAANTAGREVEILVSNPGSSTVFGTTMLMRYPTGFASLTEPEITGAFASASSCGEAGFTASCEGRELMSWDFGNLAAGQTVRTKFPLTTSSGLSDGFTLTLAPIVTADGVQIEERESYIIEAPALELAVDENQDPVIPGENLTYTIQYSNSSGTSVSSVNLSFDLPAGTTFVSASDGGTLSNGLVSWSLGTLATGEIGLVTVEVAVSGSLDEGTLLEALTEIAGTQSALPTFREFRSVTTVADDVPLQVALTIGASGVASAGVGSDDLEILVSNPGSTTVFGATMEMRFPVGLSSTDEDLITGDFDTASSCASQGFSASCESRELLIWALGNLAPGQSVRTRMPIRMSSGLSDGFPVTVAPLVTAGTQEIEERATFMIETADLSIAVDEDQDPVAPGGTLNYTIQYGNRSSGSVSSSELIVHIPEGASFQSASNGGVESGGLVTWGLGTLAAGEVGFRTLTVAVDGSLDDGTLLELASEISGTGGGLTTRQTLGTSTAVLNDTPLEMTISLGQNTVGVSARERDVEILVANPSGSTVFDVNMEMRFPEGLSSISETLITGDLVAASSCAEEGFSASCEPRERLIWDFGNLAAGEVVRTTLTLATTGSVDDGLTIPLAPVLSAGSVDIQERKTIIVKDPLMSVAIDEIEKPSLQLPQNPSVPGEEITYVIRYGNFAGESVASTTLTSRIPEGVTFVEATGSPTVANGVAEWNLGTLASEAVGEQKLRVVTNGAATSGTLVEANARITGTAGSVGDTTREAQTSAYLDSSPDLQLDVSALPQPVALGGTLDLEFNVTNASLSSLFGVTLVVRYPFGLSSLPEASIADLDAAASCAQAGFSTSCEGTELLFFDLGTIAGQTTVTRSFSPTVSGSVLSNAQQLTVDAHVTADSGEIGIATVSIPIASQADADGDEIGDGFDNCVSNSNVNQLDNELDALGDICDADDDNDGMTDVFENLYPGCLDSFVDDASGDCDGDGLSNLDEFLSSTVPTDSDTDNDNIIDGDDFAPTDGSLGRTRGDFKPDGDSDVLFRNVSNGRWFAFLSDELSISEGLQLADVFRNSDWEYQTAADFDDDGDADILLRNSVTGAWRAFEVEDEDVIASFSMSGLFTSLDWSFQTAANMDSADLDADILLRNGTSGAWRLFPIQNFVVQSNIVLPLFRASVWDFVSAGRGDSDSDADMLLRNNVTGAWRLFEIQNRGVSSISNVGGVFKSQDWDFRGFADMDADGDADLLVQSLTTNAWRVFEIDNLTAPFGASQPSLPQSSRWDFQCMGDYDGDGDSDVLLRANDDFRWKISEIQSLGQISFPNPGISPAETRELFCP